MGFWDTIASAYGAGRTISFLGREDVEGARQMLARNGIKSSSADRMVTQDMGETYTIVVDNKDYRSAIDLVNAWSAGKLK